MYDYRSERFEYQISVPIFEQEWYVFHKEGRVNSSEMEASLRMICEKERRKVEDKKFWFGFIYTTELSFLVDAVTSICEWIGGSYLRLLPIMWRRNRTRKRHPELWFDCKLQLGCHSTRGYVLANYVLWTMIFQNATGTNHYHVVYLNTVQN